MDKIDIEASCVVDAYTYALGKSMQNTKNTILRKLLDDAIITPFDSHEIEVDFK